MIDENRFQTISFKEVSFEDGSSKETAESLAHNKAERRAGTNSFSNMSFQERMLAQEAETNSFFTQSFSDRILSLRMCLRIFLLSSFQLTCAALLLGTYSLSMSFPNESVQPDELAAAYCRDSFQHQGLQQEELETAYAYSPTRASQLHRDSFQQKKLHRNSLETLSEQLCSNQLCKGILASLINQLDLVTSLSLTWLSPIRCRYQLQSDSLDKSSFEHRALPCAALLDTPRISTQLQNRQVQSFQLPMQQLCFGLVQGGVHHRASHQPALQTRTLSTALTLISLSFALDAWLKTSSKRAWNRRPLRKSLCRRSLSTRSSTTAFPTTSSTATSSFRRTLLSVLWFSFLFSNFFLSSSFWKTEVDKNNELSQTVWEQELEELQVDESFPLDPFHDHLGKENLWSDQLQQNKLEKNKKKQQQDQLSASVPDRELSQLHLRQLCLQDPASTISRQLPEESLSSSFSKQKLSEQDLSNNRFDKNKQLAERNLSQVQLVNYKFFPENFGQQLSEKQLQQNLPTDQQQLQETSLPRTTFSSSASNSPASQRRS